MLGYALGTFVSLSSMQSITIYRPYLPTLFQFINLMTLSAVFLLKYTTSFTLVFFWMIWVGAQGGTSYLNFLFMANTKTNLSCDLRLHYTERELTVNLILVS
mmetsp:Transcript_42947/g.30941  ORF Transcript_42947/g.30941 Transcript_42947/m.30941 type:complete len:102 (-) Transcript_42947:113-418(-)